MEKRDVFRYLLISMICIVLIAILIVLRGGPTGFAVFGDDEQGEFDLKIKCDKAVHSQEIIVSVPGLKEIKITEIVQEEDILKINYIFDNSNVVGEEVNVEIWIEDESGFEIKRINDFFMINKDVVIDRELTIELLEDLVCIKCIW